MSNTRVEKLNSKVEVSDVSDVKDVRIEEVGQMRSILRRFKKNKAAVVALVILLILVLSAVFAGFITPYEKALEQDIKVRLQPPSKEHWFGTDQLGRDNFARILYGTRVSLTVAVMVSLVGVVGGVIFGSIAVLYGGRVDNILMRGMDILMSMPPLVLAITMVAFFGTNVTNLIIAISIPGIPGYTRLVRATMLGVKNNEYVEAAKAMGARGPHIVLNHLLINSLSPIIVNFTIGLSAMIITTSALGFIGLGVPAPTPEWGAMLAAGRTLMRTKAYMVMIPGIMIFLTSLSFNLVGDGLRDALDPKLKK